MGVGMPGDLEAKILKSRDLHRPGQGSDASWRDICGSRGEVPRRTEVTPLTLALGSGPGALTGLQAAFKSTQRRVALGLQTTWPV